MTVSGYNFDKTDLQKQQFYNMYELEEMHP